MRIRQHFQLDRMAVVITGHYAVRKEGRARAGADIGQDRTGFDVITAEMAVCLKIALDKRHIVVVPQLTDNIFIKIKRHFAVLHVKNRAAKLLCTDEQIVCHRISAKQRTAVIRRFGLRVRPVIVFLGCCGQSLNRRKIVIGRAGRLRKRLPVGIVQIEHLGGLCGRENLDAAITVKVALGEIAFDVLAFFAFGQVVVQIHDHALLIELIRGIRIAGEDIRQLFRTDLAFRGVQRVSLQIIYTALTGAFHRDPLLFADRIVEILHHPVECFELLTVIVVPDCDRHRLLFRTAAAACQRQHDRSRRSGDQPLVCLHSFLFFS